MIKKILTQFNREKVSYCILRNYEFLLDNGEKPEDVDILILDLDKADKIMTSFGFIRHAPRYVKSHVIYSRYFNGEFLEFDFQVGFVGWNDISYLDGKDVIKRRKKLKYFYVLSDEDYFIHLTLHSLLGKRKFKEKYERVLDKLRKKKLDKKYLERNLDKRVLELAYKGSFRELEDIKGKLIRGAILKKPLTFSGVLARWLVWKRPQGKVISIIGMDGSGKSTAIKNLNNILNRHQIVNKIVYTGRGRNNILPVKKLGDRYKRLEKKLESKQKTNKSRLKCLIYTLSAPLYALDLWLRYVLRILPSKLKGEIILTDRYSSDILLMDNVPMSVKKALFSIFPKPDLTFYLYNDVRALHKRRGHALADLERQEKLFGEINRRLDSIKIKTISEKQTIRDVSDIVLGRWLSRTI